MNRVRSFPCRVLTRKPTQQLRLLSYTLPTQPSRSHLHPAHALPSPATPTVQAYLDRADSYLLPVYARPEIILAKSKGAYVWDVEGKRYLDFCAGIAVNSLGGGDGGVLKVGVVFFLGCIRDLCYLFSNI
jgi:acetylornithine aminotransferase